MTEKNANIKRLAKEFGLTSRQLLDRCRAEGLAIQNSITKLRTEDVRRIRSWLEQSESEILSQSTNPRS